MAKLVDPRNPQHKYESPICRFTSMIPLERDAVLKRGPPYHQYKIVSEPHYSCPAPRLDGWPAAYSAQLCEYPVNSGNGRKKTEKGILLKLKKDMNLSLEHNELTTSVFCADENGVRELSPLDDKILVRISAADAIKIIARNDRFPEYQEVAVYINSPGNGNKPLRHATADDVKRYGMDRNALFLLGPCDFPVDEIGSISIDNF